MHTEHLVVLLVGDDLHESLSLASHLGAPENTERKSAHANVEAPFFRLALGETDTADLGIAIRAPWHVVVIERSDRLTGGALGSDDAFGRRHVRQLWVPGCAERDDVADCGNPGDTGSVLRIDFDVTVFEVQTYALRIEARSDWTAAGRHQQIVGAYSLRAAVSQLRLDVDAGAAHLGARDLRSRVTGDPLFPERLFQLRRHSFVLDRHEPWQQLQNRHFAAEAAEDRRELDADRPAAHDGYRFWHFFQVDGFVARDDAPAIELDPGHASRRRPGGHDDLFARAQRLLLAFEHLDAAVARKPRGAFDPIDLVFLEEELDSFAEAGDHSILARLDLDHVDRDRRFADPHSPFPGMLHDLERVGVLEERLGRDASPQQTRASERLLFFDDGDLQAQLRGTDRGNVAARAGPDDDDVMFTRQGSSRLAV